MEAARVSALRGYTVTLFEKNRLGGALLDASVPVFKADLKPLIKYFVNQMDELNIEVVQIEADAKLITQGGFKSVIIATGANPVIPEIPGIRRSNVTHAIQILRGKAKIGKKVAVIGGGVVGTEVGLFLAEQNIEVIFIEVLDTFMNGILDDEKQVYENMLKKCRYSVITGKRLESIAPENIVLADKFGNRDQLEVDTIVLAVGFQPDRNLIYSLRDHEGLNIYEAGDCVKPRKIYDAIHEGHLAAKLLS